MRFEKLRDSKLETPKIQEEEKYSSAKNEHGKISCYKVLTAP